MEKETNDINEIIIRYLDGSASLDEKIRLLGWLRETEGNRSDFMTTRDLWIACRAVEGSELEVDIALGKFRQRIQQEQERIGREQSARWHLPVWTRWAGIAATVLLVLAMGYGIGKRTQNTPLIAVQNQLITAQGSKGRFTLPDGSVVWLNEASKLTYPDRFAGDKREVVLEGEAYFEVEKDTLKPFVVQAGALSVEVLGTSFDVNSYASETSIQTALLEGSVKISGEGLAEPVYLKPNELFDYRKADQRGSVETVKANLYTDWMKDRLVFDNDCLADILVSMQSRYKIEMECPEQFAAKTRLSFTIRQESLEEVLAAMAQIAPIRYEIKGGKAYVIPRE